MKKIFIFTHFDLDGVCSTLITKWTFPKAKIEYRAIAAYDFRAEVTKWLLHNSFEDYDKVFFLDLDVSGHSDLIDKENVMIIDHHKKSIPADVFKNAVVIVKEYTSASKLIYKVFKKLYNIELTAEQKFLILLIDDYDSYKLQLPLSRVLNSIFWNTNKSFDSFLENFKDGFSGLTEQQETMFKIHIMDVREIISKSKFFKIDNYEVQGQKCKVVSGMADKHINDIAEHILKKYDADVIIVVNLKSNHVSFRRKYNSTVDVSKLAETLADGGGHEYSAGGIITPQFLEFTKQLKPL
jgi:oligoribonuclease NrnB/cAMP/cGMP phosphodiesterase (DHH superfamily)